MATGSEVTAITQEEREHYERVIDVLSDEFEAADGGPMHAYLRDREDTVARVAGGLVCRPLVSVRSHTQVISFFVNEADEATVNPF